MTHNTESREILHEMNFFKLNRNSCEDEREGGR